MRMRERLRGLREEARVKVHEGRMERAERERERLRIENDALRERIEAADEERSRWLDTIEGLSKKSARMRRPHRFRRTLMIVGAAGSAYLMGAKAGRERYEQIRTGWRDLRSRVASDGASRADARVA